MENNSNYVFYNGCKVMPNEGIVFSRFGTELGSGKERFVYTDEEGNKHRVSKLRFVYESVNGPLPKGAVLQPKDNNPLNACIDNAVLINRKDYFKTYDYSYFAAADPDVVSKIKADRRRGFSYTQLAEKYTLSKGTIAKIVKGIYYNDKEVDTGC